jgi:cytochrome c-type biogenesis protein CcmE
MSDMDLTPRTTETGGDEPARRKRNWLPIVVLALVVVAGGVIVTKFLNDSVDYYCNVDEIGVRDGCEQDRRVRIQGVVDADSVAQNGSDTLFVISFNGASLPVHYQGEPGGIFKECIPVVVHGVIEDGELQGDRVEVKHSDEYVAENEERLDESENDCDGLG